MPGIGPMNSTSSATSTGLKAWLAPHAEIDLRIDGLMRANYDPNGSLGGPGTIGNRILAFEPERMLSIRTHTSSATSGRPEPTGLKQQRGMSC